MNPPTVRDASPEDAERIAKVARRSWTDTYRDIFEPEFIDDFLARAYRPDALAEQAERAAAREDAHFLVAERGGTVIGYAQYGVGPRGPELSRLYADPAHYGMGVGHALLTELERRLRGQIGGYVLSVHERNARGRRFYERHGFVVSSAATSDGEITLRRTLAPPRPSLPIETERLRLRRLDEADADGLHAIYGDAETMRFIGSTGTPTPDREATAHVLGLLIEHEEQHGFSLWAVDERDGERLVGIAGLSWVEGRGPDVEAAYLFRRDRWGRGYASEALAAVLRVAHVELGLDRVVALAYPDNGASLQVMEKAGMRPDGDQEAYGRRLVRRVSDRGR